MKEEKLVHNPSEIGQLLGIGSTTLYSFLENVYNERKPLVVMKVM